MSIAYAPQGLMGLLTPQANTTVEPEAWALLPAGFSLINGRLVSAAPDLMQRLRDYFGDLSPALTQFANAPLTVLALACTGSSYLLGRQAEVQWVDHWAQRLGIPVVTAGTAVVQALQHMGAQRLALASPYPSELTQASVAYWQSHGFEVLQVQNVATTSEGFHAIYTTGADAAAQAVQGLRSTGADAVLMLGTGMPSLQAIRTQGQGDGPPVLSSMLALMWQATSAVQPQYRDIAPWLSGALWAPRAQAMGLWQSP
ncbi:MAG: hypothetical protein EBT49_08150 [Betaproteobacteria bacterium]|nr:hypothetical protein [Betaproteobacteria bacterium]